MFRHIILLVYCPSCRKDAKIDNRNIKDKTVGHVPYIYNKCLQTRKVQTNCNAPCDYMYTGSSGRQKVTLEHSYILRELLIALHVT